MQLKKFALMCGVALAASAIVPGCNSRPAAESTSTIGTSNLPSGISSVVLARHAKGKAAPSSRFTECRGSDVGIDFIHEWNPPKDQEDRLNSYAVGVGVAVGDYDGDGLADVFLACQTKGGRLYRNLGGWRFEDVTSKCGLADSLEGMWATGCGFVDANGDGHLDLFVCGYETPVRLFLSQGSGTFEEEAAARGLDFRGAGVMLAFSDYDGDGDLDCFLLTNHLKPAADAEFKVAWYGKKPVIPEEFREYRDIIIPPADHGAAKLIEAAQYDRLYKNDGQGYFSDVTVEAGIGKKNYHGLSATWWDCNSDGHPDLYVGNDFFGPDQLYVNNGDGTFTDSTVELLPHVPWFSMGSDIADINNDGLLDLLAADMSATSFARTQLTMGELETDSWFLDYARPKQYMRNALFLNSGSPRFMEIASLAGVASTDWTWAIKFADLDGDGWVDLFVTNGMTRDFQNSDLKQQSRSFAKANPSLPPHAFWREQALLQERNLAFRNTRDLRFEDASGEWGLDSPGVSLGAGYGDLDNDGDVDIVVNNFQEPAKLYRNNTDDANFVTVQLRSQDANRFGVDSVVEVETSDLRQTRYLTLAHGFMSTDEPAAHFGVGRAVRIDRLTVRWRDGLVQSIEDLPVNHRYTIEKSPELGKVKRESAPVKTRFQRASQDDPIVHRERPFDDYKLQPLLPMKRSMMGPAMALADVNGDGWQDLYLGGAAGTTGQLYLGTEHAFIKSSMFAKTVPRSNLPKPDSEELGALFLDAEGDGDLDLFVSSGGVESELDSAAYANQLFLNDGSGNFERAAEGSHPDSCSSSHSVAAADVDRDGDLDLFIGGGSIPGQYPLASGCQLLMNVDGRFEFAAENVFPQIHDLGITTSALWSDFDGDGWIDLLVAQEWGAIRLFRNNRGSLEEHTTKAGTATLLGLWNGIAGRDLDNDGDIDYVVTNLGLNSRYQVAENSELMLCYGDFDGSGTPHVLEIVCQNGHQVPLRGKQSLQDCMPIAVGQFQSFRDFAAATVDDIFDPGSVDKALCLRVNCLTSLVLMNDGDGHLRQVALPRLAQAAPAYGVALTDVDGDSFCDILLVQNSFAHRRETGRLDGGLGLYLRGQGDGSFTPIWPSDSGIVIPQDAKSLVVGDLNHDAWPDLIAGVNDGEAQVYLNRANGPGNPILVRLQGPAGNPTGVGARVRLYSTSAAVQTAEVAAGSGYLSQSSGELFFGSPPGNQITRIDVRWPDGSMRSYPADADQTSFFLKYRQQ